MNTIKHQKSIKTATTTKPMTNFFVQKETLLAFQVWTAEGTMAYHTVKHHSSFKSMDCTATLMKNIFPDSDIAKKMWCARTKTEATVTGVIH